MCLIPGSVVKRPHSFFMPNLMANLGRFRIVGNNASSQYAADAFVRLLQKVMSELLAVHPDYKVLGPPALQ